LADELTQASHKLAETMYSQAAQQPGDTGGEEAAAGASKDEDVVDADFEEVKK
jgi:molecular chaperone DnaK